MAKKENENEKLIAILEKAKKHNFELLLTHGEIDIIDDAYQKEYKVRIDRSCPPCLVSALKTLAKKCLEKPTTKPVSKKPAAKQAKSANVNNAKDNK